MKRTWDRFKTYTPEQLIHKSSSSSIKRARLLSIGHSSSQPLFLLTPLVLYALHPCCESIDCIWESPKIEGLKRLLDSADSLYSLAGLFPPPHYA